MTSATCLSAAHGLVSYTLSNSTLAYSSTATPAVSRSAFAARARAERSAQRLADARHDSLVQVDCRPTSTLPAPRSPPPATLMPRPPKHVGSFARSQANSETALPRSTESVCLSPPSRRRCSGAITAGGTSLKSSSRACATSLLISIHAFAKQTWSC